MKMGPEIDISYAMQHFKGVGFLMDQYQTSGGDHPKIIALGF